MQNIEGLFLAGLTDVDFPADTWSAIASNSSFGIAIATQNAPVSSVAYARHEQNKQNMMLQASLSNMTPIRFGLGGFAPKAYPIHGPLILSLVNVSIGGKANDTVQQVSTSADPELDEIYAALAKQTEGVDFGIPTSTVTYTAKDEITYEGMRKVLGGNGSGTPDGLAQYAMFVPPEAKYIFDFFTEDINTILDPEATAVEKAMAVGFTLFKPAKVAGKVVDGAKALAKIDDAVDDVKDVDKVADAVEDAKDTGKAVDKGTGNINLTEPSLPNGSKPKGEYTKGDSHGVKKENETADFLANKGYEIKMLNEVNGGNGHGIKVTSNPDFPIEGKVFDCYAPTSNTKTDGTECRF